MTLLAPHSGLSLHNWNPLIKNKVPDSTKGAFLAYNRFTCSNKLVLNQEKSLLLCLIPPPTHFHLNVCESQILIFFTVLFEVHTQDKGVKLQNYLLSKPTQDAKCAILRLQAPIYSCVLTAEGSNLDQEIKLFLKHLSPLQITSLERSFNATVNVPFGTIALLGLNSSFL